MAYLMQYENMGLMDAYLLTRARRLNVLIQPNLRFFHELFGWEVELARKEEGKAGGGTVSELGRRRIMYSWPAFCRDIVSCRVGCSRDQANPQHCLNRRFLCN